MADKRTEPNKPAPKPRPRRRLAKVAAMLLATMMGLGIGEGVVRMAEIAPQVRPIWVSSEDTAYRRSVNPILSYELKPNYRNDEADYRFSYSRINAHGQRDVERMIDKPAGVRRILMLGDSIVEGHGLRSIDETISRQLEMTYSDGNTEVLNFGVSGYCTRAEVEQLEVKGLQFDPDAVVLIFVENDFDNFIPEASQVSARLERPKIIKSLFLNSHLCRLTCVQLNLFAFGDEADPAGRSSIAIGENNVVEGLRRLRELAEQHSLKTLIAVWPHFYDETIEDILPMPDDSEQLIIERLAAMEGIPVIRLSRAFRDHLSAQGAGGNPRLLYSANGDGVHPSPLGSRVAARAIKAVLEDPALMLRPPGGIDAAAVAAAAGAGGDSEPDYAMAYSNQGKKLQDEGKMTEAIQMYEKALEIDPRTVEAVFNIGQIHDQHGRTKEAFRQYYKALEIDPNFAQAHDQLGVTLAKQKRFKDAEHHLRKALHLTPSNPFFNTNIGTMYLNQGQIAQAASYLEKAIALKPDLVGALCNLGIVYDRLGKLDAAAALLVRTLEIEPDNEFARKRLNFLRSKQEKQ